MRKNYISYETRKSILKEKGALISGKKLLNYVDNFSFCVPNIHERPLFSEVQYRGVWVGYESQITTKRFEKNGARFADNISERKVGLKRNFSRGVDTRFCLPTVFCYEGDFDVDGNPKNLYRLDGFGRGVMFEDAKQTFYAYNLYTIPKHYPIVEQLQVAFNEHNDGEDNGEEDISHVISDQLRDGVISESEVKEIMANIAPTRDEKFIGKVQSRACELSKSDKKTFVQYSNEKEYNSWRVEYANGKYVDINSNLTYQNRPLDEDKCLPIFSKSGRNGLGATLSGAFRAEMEFGIIPKFLFQTKVQTSYKKQWRERVKILQRVTNVWDSFCNANGGTIKNFPYKVEFPPQAKSSRQTNADDWSRHVTVKDVLNKAKEYNLPISKRVLETFGE